MIIHDLLYSDSCRSEPEALAELLTVWERNNSHLFCKRFSSFELWAEPGVSTHIPRNHDSLTQSELTYVVSLYLHVRPDDRSQNKHTLCTCSDVMNNPDVFSLQLSHTAVHGPSKSGMTSNYLDSRPGKGFKSKLNMLEISVLKLFPLRRRLLLKLRPELNQNQFQGPELFILYPWIKLPEEIINN